MSVQCEQCKFTVVAEDTWEGKPVAYFCKLDKYEYEVCDVGIVSPEYKGKKKHIKEVFGDIL